MPAGRYRGKAISGSLALAQETLNKHVYHNTHKALARETLNKHVYHHTHKPSNVSNQFKKIS